MKHVALLLSAVAVLGFVGAVAFGEEATTAPKTETLKGKVVKVEDVKVTVKADAKEVVVTTDAKTEVTVDGKAAKVADLKADMDVEVTHVAAKASKIAATTPKPVAPKAAAPRGEE